MLLELAVGDAYGVGFECEEIIVNNNLRYVEEQCSLIKPGCYSDDTQMTLAIVECMLAKEDWMPLNLANRFVEVFKRDKRRGYAGGFYKLLDSVNDGKELLERIIPESERSGAAMRCGPLGLYELAELKEKVFIQANITHNTPAGRISAWISALLVHFFHFGGRKENLVYFLEETTKIKIPEWQGRVSTKGMDVVMAAITAIMSHTSLSEILKQCIAFGGDTDTVACIAMASASCSKEIKKDLPVELISGLENGTFGRDYIIGLDKKWTSFQTMKRI